VEQQQPEHHHHVPNPVELATAGGWIEVVRQFALVFGAALIYFGVRGLTEGEASEAVQRGLDVLHLEGRFGVDIERGLQHLFGTTRLTTTLANWVYIWLHWPVIATTLFWLHHRHRRDYLVLRNAMFLSGAIGLVIFALYPVAPPRLVGAGFIDTVTDLSTSYRVLQPPALVNRYAAVPSLHVGWNLLVGIQLWRVSRAVPLRIFAVASPTMMAVAVMATGNHYFIDGLIGSVVALTGLALALVIDRRQAAHHRGPVRSVTVGLGVDQRQVVDDDAVHRALRGERRDVGLAGDPPGGDQAPGGQPLPERRIEQAPPDHRP